MAIEKLVDNIEQTCMDRPWKSFFLSYDKDGIIIAGGAKQGLKVGSELLVYERGKQVKNPQTGMMIELPGKQVAKVTVLMLGGTTVTDEYAIVDLTEGTVNSANLAAYVIQDK